MQNSRLRENNPQSKSNIKTFPDKQKRYAQKENLGEIFKQKEKDPRCKHRSGGRNEE